MIPIPTIDPEFKAIIPPLSPEEQEQLEQNILASRTCNEPIIVWEGVLLDGHNRFEICIKHGIEFQIKEIPLPSREAARLWILENQLSRRNLTDATRIEIALLKEKMLKEKAQRNQSLSGGSKKNEPLLSVSSKPDGLPSGCGLDTPLSAPSKPDGLPPGCGQEKPLSVPSKPADCRGCGLDTPLPIPSKPKIEQVHVRKTIAAEAGISEEKLHNYLQIKKHGSPALQELVQQGELKIGTAHRLLSKEILKQLKIANKMARFVAKSIPKTGCETSNPKVHNKLTHVVALLNELQIILSKRGDHGAA